MKVGNLGWEAAAAYLYLLQLPDSLLAWEYLRRNVSYQRQWMRDRSARDSMAVRWGLRFSEDPRRDARDAHPVWLDEGLPGVRLSVDESESALRFNLWSIIGRKALFHEGGRLLLTRVTAGQATTVLLDVALSDGVSFGYALPTGVRATDQIRALRKAIDLLERDANAGRPGTRPSRIAVVHMRTIQALDAFGVGASHRQTAVALFGEEAVRDRWQPDSELRSQVRHLVRRGLEMRDGGYRRLVTTRSRDLPAAQRED